VEIKNLHSWDVTYEEAVAQQKQLAGRLELNNAAIDTLRYVAGGDISFERKGSRAISGFVIYDTKKHIVLEKVSANAPLNFPYIPGLLSFREIPPLLEAWKKLTIIPDVVLLDGHGLAHPRRFGLASHFGLWVDLPTIGCAKNLLVGEFEEPGAEKGSKMPIMEKGEQIGMAVRTRTAVKPVFVSQGHMTSLSQATELVLKAAPVYKIPEPIRRAHNLVNSVRRENKKNNN